MASPPETIAAAPTPPVVTPDLTIYRHSPDIHIVVIDGLPPADQAVELATMKDQLAAMTRDRDDAHSRVQRMFDAFAAFGQAITAAATGSPPATTPPATPATPSARQ